MTEHESHTHPSCFYRLHGLAVRSELDLPEPTGPPSDPDLELLWEDTSPGRIRLAKRIGTLGSS